jgi:hypothetical protein
MGELRVLHMRVTLAQARTIVNSFEPPRKTPCKPAHHALSTHKPTETLHTQYPPAQLTGQVHGFSHARPLTSREVRGLSPLRCFRGCPLVLQLASQPKGVQGSSPAGVPGVSPGPSLFFLSPLPRAGGAGGGSSRASQLTQEMQEHPPAGVPGVSPAPTPFPG